jgi:hypothetical protein
MKETHTFFNLNPKFWVRQKNLPYTNPTRLKNNEKRLAPYVFNLNPKFWGEDDLPYSTNPTRLKMDSHLTFST